MTIAYFISSTILGKYIQGNKKLKKSNSICLSIGLLLNMYLYLITTIIGINWIFSIVPMLFCTVHYYMFLNKKNHLNNKIDLIKYISIIIIILPNFIQSLYMGLGSYPNHFFSVDSGFHLANVYNFYYETEYPPKSLEVLGQEPFKYHFGIHALSAMISKFTSLPPHTIFLLIIPTIINFLLYSTIFEFFKQKRINPFIPASSLIIFRFLSNQSIIDYLSIFIEKYKDYHFFNKHEYYFNIWNQPHNVLSLLMIVLIIHSLSHAKKYYHFLTPLFIVTIIPLVKIPFAPLFGLGFTFQILIKMFITKKHKLLIFPILALIFMITNYFIFAHNSFGHNNNIQNPLTDLVSLSIGFNPSNISFRSIMKIFTILIYFTGFLYLAIVANKKFLKIVKWEEFGFAIFPLFFILFVNFEPDHNLVTEIWQIPDPVDFICGLIFIKYTIEYLFFDYSKKIKIIYLFFLITLIPGILSYFSYNYLLINHPSKGYEYCNNRKLGEILKKIPREGSILATNDIRYPANDYLRKNHNYAISGTLGHQSVCSNMRHISNSGKYMQNIKLIKLLGSNKWDEQIMQLCKTFKVTHIIIHKNYNYPKNIPFEKTFENSDYIIFQTYKYIKY